MVVVPSPTSTAKAARLGGSACPACRFALNSGSAISLSRATSVPLILPSWPDSQFPRNVEIRFFRCLSVFRGAAVLIFSHLAAKEEEVPAKALMAEPAVEETAPLAATATSVFFLLESSKTDAGIYTEVNEYTLVHFSLSAKLAASAAATSSSPFSAIRFRSRTKFAPDACLLS